jgi:phosphoserine aminotransferase
VFDYKVQSENGSMYNTPPCWSIYVCGLVYKHLLKNGGLTAQQKLNEAKAKTLYDAIDNSGGFFKGHAQNDCRSTMNVTFTLPSDELTNQFVKQAEAAGLDGLKGHRSVGGCRASIYNAFPIEGCEALAAAMKEFAAKNG